MNNAYAAHKRLSLKGLTGIGGLMIVILLLSASLSPRGLAAQSTNSSGSDASAANGGISLGGRAMYFRPKDADKGTYSGGAQLRVHFLSMFAVEGSIDYRQNTFEHTNTDVFPVQASLLAYLLPNSWISPYILGGAGWYYTHVESPANKTQNRFGPHLGVGLEAFLNHQWSIDGSYRYVWTENINTVDINHPAGRHAVDSGSMVTLGINYHF
jgi:opacity protein-like surface antigen